MSTAQALAEDLDRRLREAARITASSFMDFADLAAEAIREKIHERFGFLSEEQYFDERVRVSYRSLRRWLQARAGVQRLPEGERAEAREHLVKLGVHKAAALAPVLGRPEVDWREQVAFAERATTAAVQARASDLSGARPRGLPDDPGERMHRYVVNQMPPSLQDYFDAVVRKVMKVAERKTLIGTYLKLVDIANNELAASGEAVELDGSDATAAD